LDNRERPRADIQGAGRRNHPVRAGSRRALAGSHPAAAEAEADSHPAVADNHRRAADSHPAAADNHRRAAGSHPAAAEAGSHPAAGIHQEAARNRRRHQEAGVAEVVGNSHRAGAAADWSRVPSLALGDLIGFVSITTIGLREFTSGKAFVR
jgi:hypothetical protein